MRKFLFMYLLLHSAVVMGQSKKLSLTDAVLKQRTTLAPERLPQLMFVPGAKAVSYIEKRNGMETVVMSTFDKSTKADIVATDKLNAAVIAAGGDSIVAMPTISWKNMTTLTFTHKNKVWEYNIKEQTAVAVAKYEVPTEGQNIDKYDNTHVAFTIDNNLYWYNGTESRAITADMDKGVVNGQSVHRNEFGITKGTFWSPGGKYIAYYRMNESVVTEYPIIDFTKRPAANNSVRYPMAGDASHEVTVTIYDTESGNKVTLLTGEPTDQYLTNVAWSPDEKYIYIAVLNRDQNHMLFNCYNTADGKFEKTLFEEANEKYVEPMNAMIWLKKSPGQYVWQSARNGWNHLYLYNSNGVLIRQLTTGNYDVTQVLGEDVTGERIYFLSTVESGITRQLCYTEIKTGKVKQLTTQSGTHTITMDAGGEYFIDNFQSTTVARNISVMSNKGVVMATLLESKNPLSEYDLGDMKIFTLKANDGTELYCRMFTPPGLELGNEGNVKYPAIVYVYGGPHAQMINNTWNGGADLWLRYMAQQGYVVFTLDNRGSDNRGAKFEQVTFRQLGTIELQDQLVGVDYLKSLPYVDTERMGIFGWSYGGFMTVSMMLKHPGIFKTAVAGGPVIDWKYYEVMYTERYMDTPESNSEGYKNNDLTQLVQNLDGKLMLIHGTNDDVVVWQHSINFVKACVDKGVQLDYFVYPGHLHNVTGKDRAHLFQKITDYFNLYLKP